MKGTSTFTINGKSIKLPLYEYGDRVEPVDNATLAIEAKGTVKSVSMGGLFVKIDWDEKVYNSRIGGTVELGAERMVNDLIAITE